MGEAKRRKILDPNFGITVYTEKEEQVIEFVKVQLERLSNLSVEELNKKLAGIDVKTFAIVGKERQLSEELISKVEQVLSNEELLLMVVKDLYFYIAKKEKKMFSVNSLMKHSEFQQEVIATFLKWEREGDILVL